MDAAIDIIVISYNTKDLLLACLNSVQAFTPEPHQLIVVDNASHDGTVKALNQLEWSNLLVIENDHNLGYAKACNQGILAGHSPYIILLNSDVLATPGWLAPLLSCLRQDPRIAVVGPKMVDQQGRITGAGVVGTYEHHYPRGYLENDQPGKYEQQEDCFSVCGAAYLIAREHLPILGLFDEHYFFYFEETDYSLHAHENDFRVVYCPSSKIYHLSGQSNHNHTQLRRYFEESERYFRAKWKHLDRRSKEDNNHDTH